MDDSKSSGKRHEEWSPTPSSDKKRKEVSVKHRKVKQALATFWDLVDKLNHQYKASQPVNLKAKTKAMMEAAMMMRQKQQWENDKKRVGHIVGIEVGDIFQSRVELNVIGLHRQFWNGIDYMGTGQNSLATSIVVTNRYDNARKSNGTLVYSGHGGNPNVKSNVSIQDQKLQGGNLALKNSMDTKSPVRVILKFCKRFEVSGNFDYLYVYDGLYLVDKMTEERGKLGKLVFKFTLNRISEQPQSCVVLKDDVIGNDDSSGQLGSSRPRKRYQSRGSVVQKDVVRVNDLSRGKEKFPIRVVTLTNCVHVPKSFYYIVKNIYLDKFKQATIPCGCDCEDGCVNRDKCVCIIKNGGIIAYDCKKRLASPMGSLLMYECGPSCKCSSSCINRVSQHGIQFQLEIFMTELKGWGVRTRSFIPSGSFVCEYIGEVRDSRQSGLSIDVDDDYIFHTGVGKGFIDATKCGNIGRFINHSCSSNLHVKDVMYDHDDKNLPHKMLFAAKDIPAGRELSFDYNSKGKFINDRSNSCYCGSQECNGQIYN